jgi:hypothetical protein
MCFTENSAGYTAFRHFALTCEEHFVTMSVFLSLPDNLWIQLTNFREISRKIMTLDHPIFVFQQYKHDS